MTSPSKSRLQLHGLTAEDSVLAVWKLLFSPTLQKHLGSYRTLQWTKRLIANFVDEKQAEFSAQYNTLLLEVRAAASVSPEASLENPPWSMVSLDMRLGLIPWVTPIFADGLAILLQHGCALEKHFGEVLPFAFFLHGGPGDTRETAFRVCAPTGAVRAGAEHWLMRAYLTRQEEQLHATLAPDQRGRTFSLHRYTDPHGRKNEIFFETTDSFGREEEDFWDFLHDV